MFKLECSKCGARYIAAAGHECALPKQSLPKKTLLPKPLPKPSGALRVGSESAKILSGSARQARWREGHRDRYNEYQRDLMRRRAAS